MKLWPAVLLLWGSAAAADMSRQEYAAACAQLIAPLADFSCGKGALVPVTVDGQPVTSATFTPGMSCDRPALLDNGADSDGQCVPGSRILDLSMAEVQVSVMCRAKHNRDEAALLYDEIDVIAHNPTTGATCWFHAKAPDKSQPLDGHSVPTPTRVTTPEFWASPAATAADGCGKCHDNDPFMYSPFVGQVWHEVPTNPFGLYWHVGAPFHDWPTEVFNLRDNTCTGCHRIGRDATSGPLTLWMTGAQIPKGADARASTFPLSHGMPPEHGMDLTSWTTIYGPAIQQILTCHYDPSNEMCNLTQLEGFRP